MNRSSAGADPSADAPPFAPPVVYLRPPRLGIIHLLAWTAATAVILKLFTAGREIAGTFDVPVAFEVLGWATETVTSTAIGAGIVGASVIAGGRMRGIPGRLQPGHWFVLIHTLTTLAAWLPSTAVLVHGAFEGRANDTFASWCCATASIMALLRIVAYFFVARWMQDAWPWKSATRIMAAMGLAQAIGMSGFISVILKLSPFALAAIWPIMVSSTLIVAAIIDFRGGARRDWVHWLGVALLVESSVYQTVWLVASALLR